MEVNYDLLKAISDFSSLLLAAVALGFSFVSWFGNRSRATRKDIDDRIADVDKKIVDEVKDLDERLDSFENQLTKLNAEIDHLPRQKDLKGVENSVSDVKNSMSSLASSIAGLEATMVAIGREIGSVNNTVMMLWEHELKEGLAAKERQK